MSKIVGNRLTCSCAYPQAFHAKEMVKPEYCAMLNEADPSNHDYYTINCVTDLDDNPNDSSSSDVSNTGLIFVHAIICLKGKNVHLF